MIISNWEPLRRSLSKTLSNPLYLKSLYTCIKSSTRLSTVSKCSLLPSLWEWELGTSLKSRASAQEIQDPVFAPQQRREKWNGSVYWWWFSLLNNHHFTKKAFLRQDFHISTSLASEIGVEMSSTVLDSLKEDELHWVNKSQTPQADTAKRHYSTRCCTQYLGWSRENLQRDGKNGTCARGKKYIGEHV